MIYLTDGGSSDYPDFFPEYPVLWAITDGMANYFSPPFGEVISIQ
jgi:predicted metal-dependent peptidase